MLHFATDDEAPTLLLRRQDQSKTVDGDDTDVGKYEDDRPYQADDADLFVCAFSCDPTDEREFFFFVVVDQQQNKKSTCCKKVVNSTSPKKSNLEYLVALLLLLSQTRCCCCYCCVGDAVVPFGFDDDAGFSSQF